MTNLKARFAEVVKVYLKGGKLDVTFDSTSLLTTINGIEFTAEEQLELSKMYRNEPGFVRIMQAINNTPAAKEAVQAINSVKSMLHTLEKDARNDQTANADEPTVKTVAGGDLFNSDGIQFLANLLGVQPSQITLVDGDGDLLARVASVGPAPVDGEQDAVVEGVHYDFLEDGEYVVGYDDLPGEVQAIHDEYKALADVFPRESHVITVYNPEAEEFSHYVNVHVDEEKEAHISDQYMALCQMFDAVLEQVIDPIPVEMTPVRDLLFNALLDIIKKLAVDVVEKDGELDDDQILQLVLGSLFNASTNTK